MAISYIATQLGTAVEALATSYTQQQLFLLCSFLSFEAEWLFAERIGSGILQISTTNGGRVIGSV